MKILNLILVILFSISCHSQKLEITKLIDDFYVFTTYKDYDGEPFPSNGMYVVTEKGVVIIDSPWDTTQCQPLLDSIQKRHNKKVTHAIATHFHDDRTGAFDCFRQNKITTWTSYRTYDLCVKNGEKLPDMKFADITSWNFGNYTMQLIYPGEGHTKDNIVIWFEEQKILYAGCLVKSTESKTLGNLADANIKAYPETIKKVMSECPNARFVIPGHQGWQGNPLQHTLEMAEQYLKNQNRR